MEKLTRLKINTHDDIDPSFDSQLNGPAREIGQALVDAYSADPDNQKKFIYCAGTLKLEGLGRIHYVGCFTKADESIEIWFSRTDALYKRAMEDAAKCKPGDIIASGSGGLVN